MNISLVYWTPTRSRNAHNLYFLIVVLSFVGNYNMHTCVYSIYAKLKPTLKPITSSTRVALLVPLQQYRTFLRIAWSSGDGSDPQPVAVLHAFAVLS